MSLISNVFVLTCFCHHSDPFDLEKHVNKFKKIDSYTPGQRSQWKPGQPVAHFTVEVGWFVHCGVQSCRLCFITKINIIK